MNSLNYFLIALLFCSGTLEAAPEFIGGFDRKYIYDDLLKQYVNERGLVDYIGLQTERAKLDEYVKILGEVPPERLRQWSMDEQKAFYINAYNAITLVRILDHYPPKGWGIRRPKVSILNIPGVWTKIKTRVAGEEVTLDHIEHKILRPVYKDARIHAAIVCASIGCPRLANEPYTADRLEEQLERASREFARDPSKNKIDRAAGRVTLSPIFKWFKEDFETYASELSPSIIRIGGDLAGGLGFVMKYATDADRDYILNADYKVRVGKYDW